MILRLGSRQLMVPLLRVTCPSELVRVLEGHSSGLLAGIHEMCCYFGESSFQPTTNDCFFIPWQPQVALRDYRLLSSCVLLSACKPLRSLGRKRAIYGLRSTTSIEKYHLRKSGFIIFISIFLNNLN